MDNRADYVLRSLVAAQRERKLAQKTRDQGLITAAESRLQRAWKSAQDHVAASDIGIPISQLKEPT
jgi:hypothetical protein